MSRTIYMTIGLPASGKSTLARKMVAERPGKIERINKDDLRAMMHGGKHTKGNEKQVVAARDALVRSALAIGRDAIVDDTNFHPSHEETLRAIAREFDGHFEIIDLTDVPLDECIARDAKRADSVGEKVIRRMYDQYLRAKVEERERVLRDPDLPDCVIVDIDGTLALHVARDAYDYARCDTDALNENVARVVRLLAQETPVVICSGREAKSDPGIYEMTHTWLLDNGVPFDELLMRAEGDMRKDSIVKREFLEDIVTRWNPVLVIDDRDQVVEMWRNAGIECWQVAWGAF